MTAPEEIEVNVRQLEDETTQANPAAPFFDVMRRMMLAGFGAFALTRDEAEQFLNRLVDRGEIAQKDAQHLLDDTLAKFRTATPQAPQVEAQVNNIQHQVENGLEQLLNRMNIPSKRDIDELSAKIAQLAARVEELRRAGEPVVKSRNAVKAEVKAEE
jgi:poly(hydroxyalkanoate) granule-associated protein